MTDPDHTLLLRMAAPLQAWGNERGVIDRRETSPHPTKSGILGLLAAALGRQRGEPIDDLAALKVGVRIDQPGSILRDFHTASDYRGHNLPAATVDGKGKQATTQKERLISERFYLQDAAFLAAVSGPATFMRQLRDAVKRPAYPLALGRRACPPTFPLFLELAHKPLIEAMQTEPWLASPRGRQVWSQQHGGATPATITVEVVHDDPHGEELLKDQPTGFGEQLVRHVGRRVTRTTMSLETGWTPDEDDNDSGHDPLALLGW
ncbi:type I-E CRISPR-associated protein Cas5/CasD [Streptomyces noursei]